MKKMFIGLGLVLTTFTLAACSSTGTSSKSSSSSSSVAKLANTDLAKTDAQTVLDFMYKGNISGVSDVSTDSAETVKQTILAALVKKQTDVMIANNNINDYQLVVDGSTYTAQEIISDYADAYYKQISTIGDATVKSVSVSGDSTKVTASLTPIAALSEANPIGAARTALLGGIDNDTIVRDSANKDVETIQKMITLKLYGLYYGQMAQTAAKAGKTVEITFTLKKSGDHFVADEDTMLQLAKDSRAQVYAPETSSSTGTSDSSSSATAA